MAASNLKKMLVFRDLRTRSIIENFIRDEKSISGKLESALIEDHILNDIMPQNKDARYWLEMLYLDDGSIKKVTHAIFSSNAGGTRGPWSSRWGNLYPLVDFCKNASFHLQNTISGKEDELYHFRSQLDSVLRIIKKNDDIELSSHQKTYLEDLLKIAENMPNQMILINYYQLILDFWEALKDSTFTYRMLCDLVLLEHNWPETAQERKELADIIRDMSKEWD